MADTTIPVNQDVEIFLDRLLSDKFDPNTVTPEFLQESKEELRPLLLKKINLALYEALSVEDRQQFSNMVESNADDATLQEFFTAHIPNPEQFSAEAPLSFRNTYLG